MKTTTLAVLALVLGCQSEPTKQVKLVKGCDRVLAGLQRCFPGRDDVQASLREQYRVTGRADSEVHVLEEQCRLEGERLEKDCR